MSLLYKKILRHLPDKPYVYLYYLRHQRELLHLKNPRKFTQKIQWLKLYGNLERFSSYADKFTVRSYIEQKVGSEHLVPLLGVWDSFEDIPFNALPEQFVLKVTSGCNYNVICKSKSELDPKKLKTTINGWLGENFYQQERETQYKDCKPKIICEKYLEDETGGLRDYKVWCSQGVPKLVQVDSDRFTSHRSDIFDTHWNKLKHLNASTFGATEAPVTKPKNLQEVLEIASKLSRDFPFVRIDMYIVNQKVYVGELTFTPGSGMVKFETVEANIELGDLIDLDAYKQWQLSSV